MQRSNGRYLPRIAWTFLIIVAGSVSAQISPQTALDRDWLKLQDDFKKSRTIAAGVVVDAAIATTRASAMVANADRFLAFYTKNPAHPGAKEAEQSEALCLNYAAFYGNTAVETRRLASVEAVRKDAGVEAGKRFEVVAWSNQVALKKLGVQTATTRLVEHERFARGLISEFPTVHLGYESLLAVARDSAPERGRTIAADLLALTPPTNVRTETQDLLGRLGVVGQSAVTILTQAGAKTLADLSTGKVLLLYAWSKNDPRSISAAKRLVITAPTATLIGVSLDTDVSAAQATATRESLPGTQHFDVRGPLGSIASALKFSRPAQAYLADQSGIFRDANALVRTREKLTGFGK